jgi:hypothetical protein
MRKANKLDPVTLQLDCIKVQSMQELLSLSPAILYIPAPPEFIKPFGVNAY